MNLRQDLKSDLPDELKQVLAEDGGK